MAERGLMELIIGIALAAMVCGSSALGFMFASQLVEHQHAVAAANHETETGRAAAGVLKTEAVAVRPSGLGRIDTVAPTSGR